LLWPILELGLMGYFFGVFIFIQGALTLIAYLKIKEGKRTLPILLESFWGMGIGIFFVMQIDVTPDVFIAGFVAWGIGSGFCKGIASLLLYGKRKYFWVLGLIGILSILFSLMFYVQAESAKEHLAWILSIYFVVYGVFLSIFDFKSRAWQIEN
jgi:uncharacterized membrane protein HdeD (DUF308 family)